MLRWHIGTLFVLLLSLPCTAQDTSKQIFVVGVENINLLPHFNTENALYVGFSRELLDAFALKQGYRFVYRPLPIKRLFVEFVDLCVFRRS